MTIIRPATTDDFDAISKLIKTKEEQFRVYPAGSFPFSVEQVHEIAKTRTNLTVLTDNEHIIGFANLYNLKPEHHAFIGNIVIEQTQRGKGLGRRIVEHMSIIARDTLHLPEIRLSVFNENTPALLLYSDMGFTPYEIESRTNPAGNKTALIHMTLRLNI